MKIRTVMLATVLAVATSSFAMAQSSPAPANQSGGGTSATTPAPTDPGTAGVSGNTKGMPARGTSMQRAPSGGTMGAAPSTGSGMKGSSMKESQDKNASPASSKEGIKKEK